MSAATDQLADSLRRLADGLRTGTLLVSIDHHFMNDTLTLIRVPNTSPAVSAKLALGTKEDPMPGTITIDTTNETVTLSFQDRLGEDTAAPANLGPVAFTTDDPAVATVATDAANPLQGDITPVGAGTVNIGVDALVDTAGATLVEADGVTPFPVPSPQALTVNPGAAVGDRLALS